MKSLQITVFGLVSGLIAGAAANVVHAACYERIGCTDKDYFSKDDLRRLDCKNLAIMRNTIYAERGYCSNKAESELLYGNRSCRHKNLDDVPMGRTEWRNLSAIKSAERDKRCR